MKLHGTPCFLTRSPSQLVYCHHCNDSSAVVESYLNATISEQLIYSFSTVDHLATTICPRNSDRRHSTYAITK